MKVQASLYSIILLFLVIGIDAKSQNYQNHKDSIISTLVSDGFENVGIYSEKKDVYLFIENRRYRWEIDGLSRVLKLTSPYLSNSVVLHIVPMHYEVPIAVISTEIKAYKDHKMLSVGNNFTNNSINAKFNVDSVSNIRKKIQLQNKPYGKIDLIFLPGLRLQFGSFNHPVEWQVSISPILQTSLWKGSLLSVQFMLPLHNELQYQYEGKARLETATINQLFRLSKDVFIYSSAGIFAFTNGIGSNIYYQRYGISSDIRKYFDNGRISTGVTAGYTGLMSFDGGILNYYPAAPKINFAFFGEYRDPTYDFTTRLTAGKFLYDDFAVKLEISRQFHELGLSFYIIKSNMKSVGETGSLGGIFLTIPISPKKAFKPSKFRVNLARYFNFEYRERITDPLATSFKTNGYWSDTFRNLNPDFVKKHLLVK